MQLLTEDVPVKFSLQAQRTSTPLSPLLCALQTHCLVLGTSLKVTSLKPEVWVPHLRDFVLWGGFLSYFLSPFLISGVGWPGVSRSTILKDVSWLGQVWCGPFLPLGCCLHHSLMKGRPGPLLHPLHSNHRLPFQCHLSAGCVTTHYVYNETEPLAVLQHGCPFLISHLLFLFLPHFCLSHFSPPKLYPILEFSVSFPPSLKLDATSPFHFLCLFTRLYLSRQSPAPTLPSRS